MAPNNFLVERRLAIWPSCKARCLLHGAYKLDMSKPMVASCTACNQLPWPPQPASTIGIRAFTTPENGYLRVSTANFCFAYDLRDALRRKQNPWSCHNWRRNFGRQNIFRAACDHIRWASWHWDRGLGVELLQGPTKGRLRTAAQVHVKHMWYLQWPRPNVPTHAYLTAVHKLVGSCRVCVADNRAVLA